MTAQPHTTTGQRSGSSDRWISAREKDHCLGCRSADLVARRVPCSSKLDCAADDVDSELQLAKVDQQYVVIG